MQAIVTTATIAGSLHLSITLMHTAKTVWLSCDPKWLCSRKYSHEKKRYKG